MLEVLGDLPLYLVPLISGVSSSVCEYLNDEYSGQTVMSFPTLPTKYNESLNALAAAEFMLNTALSVWSLSQSTSLVTPMSLNEETFPLFNIRARKFSDFSYNPELHYHTSAILATAFDTLTLPWRLLKGPYASLQEVSTSLSSQSR